MDYSIFMNSSTRVLIYSLVAFFLFICVLGDRKYKVHSFILFLYFIISIVMPELNQSSIDYNQNWINQCFVSLQITGAASLAMLLFMPFDKLNKFHWCILISAVLIHSMMVSYLEGNLVVISIFTKFFYDFYDELIIINYLAMIGVSYNGFYTAYSNALGYLQRFIHGHDVYYDRLSQDLLNREKAKKRT